MAVERPDDDRSQAVALIAAAIALIAGGVAAANWMLDDVVDKWELVDLSVYRAAGKAVLHGHSIFGDYVGDQLSIRLPFIYPPFGAIVAIPFALLPAGVADLIWTALTLALLFAVIRLCFAPLIERFRAPRPVVLALLGGVCLALSPIQEHLRFGQVGIFLMACCVLDCMIAKPRWRRGLLIGIATAVKLTPGIFIPYLAMTRRWKAAVFATLTFLACSLIGLVVAPSDSWDFWTDKMFEPTSPKFFTNQSLEGMLQRAVDPGWRPLWMVVVVVVFVYGMRAAVRASRTGDELRGVALTALVGVLISPISWVHHLVWIVPILATIVGNGRSRRQIVIAFAVAAVYVARVPYIGEEIGDGFLAALLKDGYGLVNLALLVYLAWPTARARRTDRAATTVSA